MKRLVAVIPTICAGFYGMRSVVDRKDRIRKGHNRNLNIQAIIFFLIGLFIMPVVSIAGEACKEKIKLYDEEMLLKDLSDKTGKSSETQKPLVQFDGNKNQIAIEVPGSIKYSASHLEEGARLFRSGKYEEAAAIFEAALENYRKEGFEEGEVAVLGNLYLTYRAMGNEEKALDYLAKYHKKRRRK